MIFGYGSLICPESIARTLKRDVRRQELEVVDLIGWRRTWNYVVECSFKSQPWPPKPTVFLNIERNQKIHLPGVIFEVSAAEILNLDDREYGYSRVDVTAEITPKPRGLKVLTYVANPGFNSPSQDAVLPQDYLDLVKAGARAWGESFESRFWASTQDHKFRAMKGPYGVPTKTWPPEST